MAVTLLAGCLGEAPRSNPLDPLADDFADAGEVTGRVTSFYAPFLGLEGARVVLAPQDLGGPELATRADATGAFLLRSVPSGAYTLTATRDGYDADTAAVTVAVAQQAQAELRLNGQPHATAVQVRTLHISRWWPLDDLYRLDLDVEVADPDGLADITAVRLRFPTLGFADTLQVTPTPGLYSLRRTAAQLPGGNLPGLLGQPFEVDVVDRAGAVGTTIPQTLVRVIDPVPVALRPQGLATVEDATPVLEWEPLGLPFPFTHRVEIVRVEADVETRAQTIDALPQGALRVEVPEPLAPGSYYWTVAVVDGFGNLSRSKEAGFVVP